MPDIYADTMTRTTGEGERLNEQFDLITSNLGYLVHPRIAAALPAKPRIADIGTGSGHFLRCMQKSYPDAVMDGYDISPAMFPTTTLPNITFGVMDMKQPVPEELHGKYDLVHARLLVVALLPGEWAGVVQNLTKLLKPGGWLQWGECDFAGATCLRGTELASARTDTVTMIGLKWQEEQRERFSAGWNTLPGDMKAAGLDPVETDRVSCDRLPETRKRVAANAMVVMFSWQRMLTMKGVLGSWTVEELEATEKRAAEDIETGAYVRYDIYVHCGQKPVA